MRPERHVRALARDLERKVRGQVRFDRGSRALYATDASNYRQPPIGVVLPRDAEDAVTAIEVCRRHDAPIFGRGGGTSLAGQCCNEAVCFDFTKYMHHVRFIDARRRVGRVEPGTNLDDLRAEAASYGLTFGPDPATHSHCTLGGMVGNDSCGVHSVMAQFQGQGARTSDNIDALDVVTYDGTRMQVGATSEDDVDAIVRRGGRQGEIYGHLRALRDRYADDIRRGFPDIPRRVSGYNLPALLPENGFHVARALVGSEGTCVMVLGVDACLLPSPGARTLLVLGYPDVYQAGDHVPEILESRPIGLEGLDDRLVADMKSAGLHTEDVDALPEGRGWLLVEFGGETHDESRARARRLMDDLRSRPNAPTMHLIGSDEEAETIWAIRESGLAATAHVESTPTWPGWEDSAVPPEKVGTYLRQLRALLDRFGYECDLYGHFGQGCIHTRIDFDLESTGGVQTYRRFVEEAADLVVRLGGSISGEHGDGQARGELLGRMFSPRILQAFREFKQIFDPGNRMNPGKVIDASPLDSHLRLLHSQAPTHVETHFAFPDDGGRFQTATRRCVGVGECRRTGGGTMCPSYMVTRDEEHSTRGRARLLFEMLEGEPLDGGWRDPHVKDALDLCLACKGCKRDCPVGVDMASYKAEFLSHYYDGRIRPRSAWAFGFIAHWADAGALAPRWVNLVTQAPGLASLCRLMADMPSERRIPAFAPETFRRWFTRSRRLSPAGFEPSRDVILWTDTFTDHFHPETAVAAVRVLERAGRRVRIPQRALCCGRPLYDFGMLDTARRWLRRAVTALGPAARAGVPIVGLEPSCVAVFRDELRQWFPDEDEALTVGRQMCDLGEFLARHAPDFVFPETGRRVLVHGHCHQKSVLDFDATIRAVRATQAQVEVLDSGCCGMAGAFGFERGHYDVSVGAGERVLLPAVRHAPTDALIVTDGFSCREQIAQLTDRRALHLAEFLEVAADTRRDGGHFPERRWTRDYAVEAQPSPIALSLAAAAAAAAGAWLWRTARRA